MRKAFAVALAVLLTPSLASAQGWWGMPTRHGPVGSPQYRAWVAQQNAMRSQQMADPLYRRYANSRMATPASLAVRQSHPYTPSYSSMSWTYYRGPAGEIVRQDQLPRGAILSGAFKPLGSYSASNPYHPPSATHHPR